METPSFQHTTIQEKFLSYPEPFRTKLFHLRNIIFDVAEGITGGSPLKESLKWGEPSYQSPHGSPIRMDWKQSSPQHYALYFNCKTSLIETFKNLYGDLFVYEGTRGLLFTADAPLPEKELRHCITLALTYHKRQL